MKKMELFLILYLFTKLGRPKRPNDQTFSYSSNSKMPTSTRHCGNLLQHARAPVCSSQGHVPRSELSIAANQHSISQYSLQSGDSRKALVRNGRAERAGRIVAGCYHLSEPCWSVGWGGGGMSHRGTSAPVCSLCRVTASTAFRRAGLCRSTSELWMCVLCRTGRTGSHLTYPSRWGGHLSIFVCYMRYNRETHFVYAAGAYRYQ